MVSDFLNHQLMMAKSILNLAWNYVK